MKKETKKQNKENDVRAEEKAPQKMDDYYSLVEGIKLPKLPLEERSMYEDYYKKEVNRRIRNFTRMTGISDTVVQGAYVMLELCAEREILYEIIKKDRNKIKQLEAKQKEINWRLQKLLDHLKKESLKAEVEK